ncbi:hypothetical protein HDV63DRAFT_375935 [Trichoderma sp. SZMC 28014]
MFTCQYAMQAREHAAECSAYSMARCERRKGLTVLASTLHSPTAVYAPLTTRDEREPNGEPEPTTTR